MPNGEIELRVRLTARQAALLLNCVNDRADDAVSYLRFTDHAQRPTAWEGLAELMSAAIIAARALRLEATIEGDGRQSCTFRVE